MKNNHLQNKTSLRSALLILLLSAVGMMIAKAPNNTPAGAIKGHCTVIANDHEATCSFAKPDDKTLVANFVVASMDGDHDYVDLGLPSGTLWATCNVGANVPEEYGDYLAWGETQSKSTYDWSNYKYGNGDHGNYQLFKYTKEHSYNNHTTDNLTFLQPMDDAAAANWGNGWCMPTPAQWEELLKYTTNQWIIQNGVNGREFTSSNGNSLFLPAAGFREGGMHKDADIIGGYWSNSLDESDAVARAFISVSEGCGVNLGERCIGFSVRAVRSSRQNGFKSENNLDNEGGNGGGYTYNGHEYVDLGLPSGTLWATCNVGANAPEEYGDYFAWGETTPKSTYNWSTYKYCKGDYDQLTKYCNKSNYGHNGFTDNLTALQPADDAATANWGNGWRMPTYDQWRELYQNTTHFWAVQNGVNGRLFTAANGNSLFLPAAGCRWEDVLDNAGRGGYYWSNSLNTDDPIYVWDFALCSHYGCMDPYNYRLIGLSVRAVCSLRQN